MRGNEKNEMKYIINEMVNDRYSLYLYSSTNAVDGLLYANNCRVFLSGLYSCSAALLPLLLLQTPGAGLPITISCSVL